MDTVLLFRRRIKSFVDVLQGVESRRVLACPLGTISLELEALEGSFAFSANMGSQVDRSAAMCSDERETHQSWISVVSCSCTLVQRKRLGDSEEHRIQQRARSAAKQQQRSRATTHGVLATAEAF